MVEVADARFMHFAIYQELDDVAAREERSRALLPVLVHLLGPFGPEREEPEGGEHEEDHGSPEEERVRL